MWGVWRLGCSESVGDWGGVGKRGRGVGRKGAGGSERGGVGRGRDGGIRLFCRLGRGLLVRGSFLGSWAGG